VKEFFDGFAQEKGFDPLNPEGWYQTNLSELKRRKVSLFSPSILCATITNMCW